MANRGFHFKQFKIAQEGAALKVGTDACILGAWTQLTTPSHILDIGTGTGLLALMLAQRYDAAITALEPEPKAAAQARQNFNLSPWPEKINLVQLPVQDFYPSATYDLIICNPPFYPNHLKAASSQRNLALHQDALDFKTLAVACKRLLAPDGLCYILLPPRQAAEFEQIASQVGLYPQKRLWIQEREDTAVHRTITAYGNAQTQTVKPASLIIRAESGAYSEAYQDLLRDYYLIF